MTVPYGILGSTIAQAQLPRLLAAERRQRAAQAQPEKKPDTVWSRLGQLFAGVNDPRLSDEQNAAARRQAMMMAGIGMMGTTGNLGEQLAAGVMTGQQAGQAARGREISQEQSAEMRELLGSGVVDEPMLRTLFARSIANGDIEIARALSEVLKSMGGIDGQQRNVWATESVMGENGQPKTIMYNRATGEVRETGYGAMPKPDQLRPVMDPKTGRVEYYQWNPATGRWTPTGMMAQVAPNEKQQVAAFMLPLVNTALAPIDAFEGAPDRLLNIVAKSGYNELARADYQMLTTAGQVLGDAYLRLTSGAAIKEEEVRMFMQTYLPAPGDSPQTLAFKQRLRGQFREGLEMLAAKVPGAQVRVLGLDGREKTVTRRNVDDPTLIGEFQTQQVTTRKFFEERK